ncbi:MAG: tRNA pseudouridine(13) synthase TruD [Candidatus Omnitrophica bacterium]|nr:tRNA pseudouridine(13) synthase TruD [Candidatus Omnitrophota bacterium]
MHLKIKVKPEDFLVKEIVSLSLSKKGDYAVYLLEKRGWNTVELLLELSRTLGIPLRYFSYGGRKDRYSLTSQYISIKTQERFALKEKDYALKFVGFMERPMGPDLIQENQFAITVRKLSKDDTDKTLSEIEKVIAIGYPNYFDDQRFGSFDPRGGFLAEKLLRQEFAGALKIWLASIYPQDKKEERDRKRFFFENWRSWQACLRKAKTGREKKAFEFLARKPNGFLEVLKDIPRCELSTYISSYQAFLWNEILRRLIKLKLPHSLKSYKGLTGEYLFYAHLDEKDYRYFRDLDIPSPGAKPETKDELIKSLYLQVLEAHRIKNSMFNKMKVRQAFFKSIPRLAIVKPQGLTFDFLDDELYPGKKKLELKFSLPRGSFATMFVKRLFS